MYFIVFSSFNKHLIKNVIYITIGNTFFQDYERYLLIIVIIIMMPMHTVRKDKTSKTKSAMSMSLGS